MAAELSLFEPQRLLGVVRELPTAPELKLLNMVRKEQTPVPFAEWEITRGRNEIAEPNVPNAEANIVDTQGFENQHYNLAYTREKKVFQPTTLRWLREVGTADGLRNAEAFVMEEMAELNKRVDTYTEFLLWQAVQGGINIDHARVKANVDYRFLSTHKVTAATPWATAAPTDIVKNINGWTRLVKQDGKVAPTHAFTSYDTVATIVERFTEAGVSLLTDRLKDEFWSTGTLTGFLGVNWEISDEEFDVRKADGTLEKKRFLDKGKIVFANPTANNALSVVYGPSADDEAPAGYVGKFSKTWKERDPSARQILLESHSLPILRRPDQFLVATI